MLTLMGFLSADFTVIVWGRVKVPHFRKLLDWILTIHPAFPHYQPLWSPAELRILLLAQSYMTTKSNSWSQLKPYTLPWVLPNSSQYIVHKKWPTLVQGLSRAGSEIQATIRDSVQVSDSGGVVGYHGRNIGRTYNVHCAMEVKGSYNWGSNQGLIYVHLHVMFSLMCVWDFRERVYEVHMCICVCTILYMYHIWMYMCTCTLSISICDTVRKN